MFKKQIMSIIVALAIASLGHAQTIIGFYGPDPVTGAMAAPDAQTTTAKVVALGALVPGPNADGSWPASTTQSTYLTATSYFVRKVALHKIVGDTQGPNHAYLWTPADPGRGRWSWGSAPLPDGQQGDGIIWFTIGTRYVPVLGVVVFGEGTAPVGLLCTTCGHTWSAMPIVGADGELLNDACPACGGQAVTDSGTIE